MKYVLTTEALNDFAFMQTLIRDEVELLSRWVCDTREEGAKRALKELGWLPPEEADRLRIALHDAINRPMGVVPDSAVEFYEVVE